MKLTSALLMIVWVALASGPTVARGGQGQSSMRSGSPMFQGSQFHHFTHHGFVRMHNGQFHHHFRSTVIIVGSPFFYYPYPYPYYYYPPMSYLPPDYAGGGGAPSPAYWYYCDAAKAYYPYVKECPGGWQQVMPQPPPSSGY